MGALGHGEAPDGSRWRCCCDEQQEARRLKRAGDLLPARPDWWPQTKRPRSTPGGLIAASVTYMSHQESLPACLRTAPPLHGTLGIHGLPDVSRSQGMHACSWSAVPTCFGVARFASSPKAAQALGCSLTPGLRVSFGRVTCIARAFSVPGLWTPGFLPLCGACVWIGVSL